jgi:hypothetical protein
MHPSNMTSNSNTPFAKHTMLSKLDLFWLSKNPSAIPLLEKVIGQGQYNINWFGLSRNPSPDAMTLLELYPEKIDWYSLSSNPSAVPLLKKYPNNINWNELSKNLSILDIME